MVPSRPGRQRTREPLASSSRRWVRERGDFDLVEGVRRLTSHPADLYGIPNRGRIELGAQADLLLFDPATVGVSAAERVADQLQERYERGAADGFALLPFFLNYPSGLAALTEGLIPELQRRGLFHTDYEHETLRANLGLAPYVKEGS